MIFKTQIFIVPIVLTMISTFAYSGSEDNIKSYVIGQNKTCIEAARKWIDKVDPNQNKYRKDLFLKGKLGAEIHPLSAKESKFSTFGYTDGHQGDLSRSSSVRLNKSKAPGAGMCCVFNANKEIVLAEQVLDGNDGCWAKLKELKKEANNKNPLFASQIYHGILYWCAGSNDNCFLDTWYNAFTK